jgi:LysR family transcriptional regulator, low CO2-responsive transcriptional regulator
MISADALAAFAVFAEHLNFTRAAARLHISQPALHVKVRRLAEALDRPLYHRYGRRLVLTPDGEAVARFARDQEDRLAGFLAGLGGTPPDRPVVLAAGQGAYLYLLGDVIRALLSEQPARLRLINCDRTRMLAAVRTGRAHLGISVLDVLPDDLVAVPLAAYPQTLLMPAGHPLARRRTVRLRDIDGADLVVPPPQGPQRSALEAALRAAQVDWSVAVEAEGWPLISHFVALGVGLAVVNGCVPAAAGLASRPVRDLPSVSYFAVHRPGVLDDPRVADLLTRMRRGVPRRRRDTP